MENKEQDPALQTPAEANRDKHMNYLASEQQETVDKDEENKGERLEGNTRNKRDKEGANDDSTNQTLQHENLIDPGNEHNHLTGSQANKKEDSNATTGNSEGE
jgi:hypothetical protein